jgi:hypothetical protein
MYDLYDFAAHAIGRGRTYRQKSTRTCRSRDVIEDDSFSFTILAFFLLRLYCTADALECERGWCQWLGRRIFKSIFRLPILPPAYSKSPISQQQRLKGRKSRSLQPQGSCTASSHRNGKQHLDANQVHLEHTYQSQQLA